MIMDFLWRRKTRRRSTELRFDSFFLFQLFSLEDLQDGIWLVARRSAFPNSFSHFLSHLFFLFASAFHGLGLDDVSSDLPPFHSATVAPTWVFLWRIPFFQIKDLNGMISSGFSSSRQHSMGPFSRGFIPKFPEFSTPSPQ